MPHGPGRNERASRPSKGPFHEDRIHRCRQHGRRHRPPSRRAWPPGVRMGSPGRSRGGARGRHAARLAIRRVHPSRCGHDDARRRCRRAKCAARQRRPGVSRWRGRSRRDVDHLCFSCRRDAAAASSGWRRLCRSTRVRRAGGRSKSGAQHPGRGRAGGCATRTADLRRHWQKDLVPRRRPGLRQHREDRRQHDDHHGHRVDG